MQETIKKLTVEAMRAKDELRLNVLRGITSAFTYEAHSKGETNLTEDDCVAVIRRLIKQRKDSIEQFEKGGRADLADTEKKELSILETLVPSQMSEDDVREVVETKKAELGITDKKDQGRLMAGVMKDLKGKADGALVKKVVEGLF